MAASPFAGLLEPITPRPRRHGAQAPVARGSAKNALPDAIAHSPSVSRALRRGLPPSDDCIARKGGARRSPQRTPGLRPERACIGCGRRRSLLARKRMRELAAAPGRDELALQQA
jgi:hypothetical protein